MQKCFIHFNFIFGVNLCFTYDDSHIVIFEADHFKNIYEGHSVVIQITSCFLNYNNEYNERNEAQKIYNGLKVHELLTCLRKQM